MRQGIMLCYPWSESRLLTYKAPYIVEPKLNGDRCRAIIKPGYVELLSSQCNRINMLPELEEQLHSLMLKLVEVGRLKDGDKLMLDGELYNHDLSHQDIHGIVARRVNPSLDSFLIRFYVFDAIINDNKDTPQVYRTDFLHDFLYKEYLSKYHNIKVVNSLRCDNVKEVKQQIEQFVKQGYEGAVIKNPYATYVEKRSTNWMKIKPRKFDTYKVVGYKEAVDKYGVPKGELGAFIVADQDGKEFSVGSGFTQDEREKWWLYKDAMIGMDIIVAYPELTKRGIPSHPVFKGQWLGGERCGVLDI